MNMLPLKFNWRLILICLAVGYLLYSNYLLHHYEVTTKAQAQEIELIKKEKQQLTAQLTIERNATVTQLNLEQQAREKSENDVKIIYKTLSNDACSSARLPDDVIRRLRNKTGN